MLWREAWCETARRYISTPLTSLLDHVSDSFANSRFGILHRSSRSRSNAKIVPVPVLLLKNSNWADCSRDSADDFRSFYTMLPGMLKPVMRIFGEFEGLWTNVFIAVPS